MSTEISKLLTDLDAQRADAMEWLDDLADDQLDYALPIGGAITSLPEEGGLTIRRLLHRVITHHEDHIQHLRKTRERIGKPRTEVDRLLGRIQIARAELLAEIVGLDDENLAKDVRDGREMSNLKARGTYPGQSEVEEIYTIKRIVQHVVEMEEIRWAHVRQALDIATLK